MRDPRHPRSERGAAPARRPPGRRPISPRSPLTGRQLWRIGDWGGASEQIGRQWERIGARALESIIGAPRPGPDGDLYTPRRALVLATEPALAAQVQAAGKAHADAILIGESGDRTILEPVDFKWTLETANPKQVGADVLTALLADAPALLSQRLAEQLEGLPNGDAPLPHDGIFLAPDHAENRAFLAPRGPLDPVWAVLCQVDPIEFFSALPGWEMAVALARLDGAYLGNLESSDRYYRLGAGVLGGVRRLRTGIFSETPAQIDGMAELARLRRDRRLNQTGDIVAYLDRALMARAELVERLREVERGGYPFGLFKQDLASRGHKAEGPGGERRFGRLYGSVQKRVGEQVRAAGRALVEKGASETQALADLDTRRPHWTQLARRLLDQSLRTG